MITLDTALDEIMQLDFQSREMLIEILQKRQIETKRNSILKSAKASLKEYRDGKIIPMNAEEVTNRLDSL